MLNLLRRFVPSFLLSWYHFILALLEVFFYWFPSRYLKVIGVTGTNGKTTTTEIISEILEETGYKVALINSIRFKIGEKEEPNLLKMTMPGRFKIQRFLRKAVNSGCQYAILEVTSEGIKQYRHKFIDFEVAVLTNLTPEHIEAHRGFENYRAAKGKLFQATKGIHIINSDDKNAEYFLQFPAQKKILFTLSQKPDKIPLLHSNGILSGVEIVKAEKDFSNRNVLNFKIRGESFSLNLICDFNISNALAAICVGLSQGIDLQICKRALKRIKGIPGRMELVIAEPFKVFVDYAFTPNALEKVYQYLDRWIKKENKMICVLGACGGGRDKWKRPVLGEIAAKYCDEVIVTNEDPYDEDPMKIINQVAEGTKGKAKRILDRRQAIKKSLELAKPGDIVIITGKGCEPWISIARGKKIPWDDRRIIKEEFNKINDPNLRITSE